MSEHEQDAVMGRLVREQRDRKHRLVAVGTALERLSAALVSLGELIKTRDNLEFSPGASLNAINTNPVLSEFEISKLTMLLSDYGELQREVKRHEEILRDYGIC